MRRRATAGKQPLASDLLTLFSDAAHAQRQRETRRPAYLEFLVRVEAALGAADPTSVATLEQRRAVSRALDALLLVGPSDVVETAQHLASIAQQEGRSPSDVEQARTAFLTSARSALGVFSGDLARG
ncbi:hypothetical protein [Streptomyces sp. NPDC055400]